MSDIDAILNDGGDAADILAPPQEFLDFIEGRLRDRDDQAGSRARHPSNQEPDVVEYDLNDILGGL